LTSISICDIDFKIIALDEGIWRLLPMDVHEDIQLARLAASIQTSAIKGMEDLVSSQSEMMLVGTQIDWDALAGINKKEHTKVEAIKLPIRIEQTRDLENMLKEKGLDYANFERKLKSSRLSISNFGFIPGFIYIEGLDADLHFPRKQEPIQSCPPRSIAIGGPYLGLYNYPSPAGWHIIGQAAVSLDLDQIKEMAVGQFIKLELLEQSAYEALIHRNISLRDYNA